MYVPRNVGDNNVELYIDILPFVENNVSYMK
jgi:hypothetical protein